MLTSEIFNIHTNLWKREGKSVVRTFSFVFLSPTSLLLHCNTHSTLTHANSLLSNCKIKRQAEKSEREERRGAEDFTSTAVHYCLLICTWSHHSSRYPSVDLWGLWLLVLQSAAPISVSLAGGRAQRFPRLPVWLTSNLLQRSARQCITDAPASPQRLWRNLEERRDREKTQEQEEW